MRISFGHETIGCVMVKYNVLTPLLTKSEQ
jgi:hypothetical protein